MIKKLFALTLISLLLSAALSIYWEQEFKHYLPIKNQETLPIQSEVALTHHFSNREMPTFYHFFDANCKNARINMDHISKVISPYQGNFNFIIVVPDKESEHMLRTDYELPAGIHILRDMDKRVTETLRIQTTPYAAILDVDNTLYFRGNYRNANGLCGPADIKWSAPALALASKNKKNQLPLFQPYQLVAQGCRIN